jgi:hypothetical protein
LERSTREEDIGMFLERCCAFFAAILLPLATNAKATPIASSDVPLGQMWAASSIRGGHNQVIHHLSSLPVYLNVLPSLGASQRLACERPGEAKTTATERQHSPNFQSYPPGDHSTSGGKDRFLCDIRTAANEGGSVGMTHPHQRLHPFG